MLEAALVVLARADAAAEALASGAPDAAAQVEAALAEAAKALSAAQTPHPESAPQPVTPSEGPAAARSVILSEGGEAAGVEGSRAAPAGSAPG